MALFVFTNLVTSKNNNKDKIINNTNNRFMLCGKDQEKYLLDKNYKNISENRAIIFYGNHMSSYKIELFDGCQSKIITIFNNNDTENAQVGNKYYIMNNRYFINLAPNYELDYNRIYFVDLQNVNLIDYLTNEYKAINLSLAHDETILNYEYPCGDGCDSETRKFSATTTENSISIDIFDKNKKYDLVLSNGIKVKANTKVRAITLGADKFEK